MNLLKKIILIFGIVVLFIMWMFPQYIEVLTVDPRYRDIKKTVGYHPFFKPPQGKYLRIDTQRLAIQLLFLALIITCSMLLFSKSLKIRIYHIHYNK